MALFGQYLTHIGDPPEFSTHSSHFIAAPSSPAATAPYGQDKTQVKHPTHLFLSILTTPSTLLIAPAIQPFTQDGSSQWRQETAYEILPLSSTVIRGFIGLSFRARAMSSNPEFAYAQIYSHKRHFKHHSS
jgi:hypothetical protein